jgi:Tol biopolymer transport system component
VLGAAVALAVAIAGARALLTERVPADTPSPTPPASRPSTDDFLLDLQTGVTRSLPEVFTSLDDPANYAISRDGSSLVFTARDLTQIYVANVDGTGMRLVADQPFGAFYPSWSPDGSAIVFVGWPQGSKPGVMTILVLDLATGQITPVMHGSTKHLLFPNFSPDGGTILFTEVVGTEVVGQFDRDTSLWTVPAKGGQPSLLLRNAALGSYSPDGSTIAYLEPVWEGDYWLTDADGSRARRLVRAQWADVNPVALGSRRPMWSPDGTRVALKMETGCCEARPTGRIGVVDLATGTFAVVAEGSHPRFQPTWLDDDTLIIESRR